MIPGAGAVAGFIERCTGKEMENIGKPSKHMLAVIRKLGLRPKKTIMIGDGIRSDIPVARNLGYGSALVLTGVTSRKNARGVTVLKSLKEILN